MLKRFYLIFLYIFLLSDICRIIRHLSDGNNMLAFHVTYTKFSDGVSFNVSLIYIIVIAIAYFIKSFILEKD